MTALLDLRIWLALALAGALAWGGVEHMRGNDARTSLAQASFKQEQQRADRAEAARTDEQNTANLEHQHAGLTLAAAERFSLAAPGRELQLRAALADARRVRDGAEVRAARNRAQSEGDAAARRDLADRCEALDGQLTAGLGVVAALRGDLERRDAEVMLLVDQIKVDRVLLEGSSAARITLLP